MKNLAKLSELIAQYFSSSAAFHLIQVSDGSYRKTGGQATAAVIKRCVENERAIACYQKNADNTMNWICFDFDVVKSNIDTPTQHEAESHLLSAVKQFVEYLNVTQIVYLVEFSGNRGIHVWIHFAVPINPGLAYSLVQIILEQSSLSIDDSLVAIDLFPASASYKSSYGKGVKTPLSKHAKSKRYSLLLDGVPISLKDVHKSKLDEEVFAHHFEILRAYKPDPAEVIQKKLGVEVDFNSLSSSGFFKIQTINLSVSEISVEEIMAHWDASVLMTSVSADIRIGELSNSRRQMLVGMLKSLRAANGDSVGEGLLFGIFKRLNNYDESRTIRGLAKLKHFHFPTQETIELILNVKLDVRLDQMELVRLIIPNCFSIVDGSFVVDNIDVSVSRVAEINYLRQNDEVRCIRVVDELESVSFEEANEWCESFMNGRGGIDLYRHFRKEKNKETERQLITLGAKSRLFSTWAIKCLSGFFEFYSSKNSFGYRLNSNFAGGHIFQPWLHNWIRFLSDIKDMIENDECKDQFVVKTDVKSFYDSIPRDALARFLLEGINKPTTEKIKNAEEEVKKKYFSVVDALLRITEKCSGEKKGLPQGPAYARYLAEVYLSGIDRLMDKLVEEKKLVFYHRYVDDIFFIAQSEKMANEGLCELARELDLIGLDLNNDKTSISPVSAFAGEFEEYRSQAKYAVDTASRDFTNATVREQELALSKFNALVHSQESDENAVFLFSHLPGHPQADAYRDSVAAALVDRATGRGNLFRHIFSYVLERESLWASFLKIEKFSVLQSEVFTSVLIEKLVGGEKFGEKAVEFVELILKRFSFSELVNEHLLYIKIYSGIGGPIQESDPALVLDCIRLAGKPDGMLINKDLLMHCRSTLNDTADILHLIDILYPACVFATVDGECINGFASIFYEKLARDVGQKIIAVTSPNKLQMHESQARKFYHLLSLFSLSDYFKSEDVLIEAWEFCISSLNSYHELSADIKSAEWQYNFSNLSISNKHLNFILASISDGGLIRQVLDRHGAYNYFHNALVILLLTDTEEERRKSLKLGISGLKEKAVFYSWIFDDNVEIFPSRNWFIKNATVNDVIMLQKNRELLFRRRVDDFIGSEFVPDNASKRISGYGNVVVNYNISSLTSIYSYLHNQSDFFSTLRAICNVLRRCACDKAKLPNLFFDKSVIDKESLEPFTAELAGGKKFIFETPTHIEELEANTANFVKCVFQVVKDNANVAYLCKENSMTIWKFYATHLSLLSPERELFDFLENFIGLIGDDSLNNSVEANFDIAVACALYATLTHLESDAPLVRISRFLEKYNEFHRKQNYLNKLSAPRKHIYKCDGTSAPSTVNLQLFFDSITLPLEGASRYRPDLTFGLVADMKLYQRHLVDLLDDVGSGLTLSGFTKEICLIDLVEEKVTIVNKGDFAMREIVVVNAADGLLENFSSKHAYYAQSWDVFVLDSSEKIYMFFAHKILSVAYKDVVERHRIASAENSVDLVYPFYRESVDELDIESAIKVVRAHRGCQLSDARSRLKHWLAHMPPPARKPLLELIKAHEYIIPGELEDFKNRFRALVRSGGNPFFIKHFGDYNGTHRILSENPEVARCLHECGPFVICGNPVEATLVSDVCISGSQVIKALKYYIKNEHSDDGEDFYEFSDEQRSAFLSGFKSLRNLNIATVLYTEQAVQAIQEFLRENGINCNVQTVGGRNVSSSATYKNTTKLSAKQKQEISAFLKNAQLCDDLMRRVFLMNKNIRRGLAKKLENHEQELNLVCRYKSMPKRGLDFLFENVRGVPDTSIFIRVKEKTEVRL